MRVMAPLAFCLAVFALASTAASQRAPISPADPSVGAGIADARITINNIVVAPGEPGWVDRFVLKTHMSACLLNFEKMLRDGKVIGGDPRLGGTQVASNPESVQNGKSIQTTGVGIGAEEILLGPAFNQCHPLERGQKCIHEGARVKQRLEKTDATLLPNNGGPGPNAPPGERCDWLRTELVVYDTDAAYYSAAASQAQAAGAPPHVVSALQKASQQRQVKADGIREELNRDC
jgi:hypothetical protein